MSAAIVLAAGASTRMAFPKALLPFRGGTFLSHLTARLAAHCNPVVAVGGAHPLPSLLSAKCVVNAQWPAGQLSSLQCGLRSLPQNTLSTLFTLVDHPDPAEATLVSLLNSRSVIAIPVYQGRRGHPVFFHASIMEELLALPSSGTAKQVFSRHVAETDYITVDDPAIIDDVDDPESLVRFRRRTGDM